MNQIDLIRSIQRRVAESPDGVIGPKTLQAIAKAVGAAIVTLPADKNDSSASTVGQEGRVDSRSEGNIATLHPKVQLLAWQLIRQANEQGMTFKITSSYRSYADQDELYAKGRTRPGPIVTNARGGHSAHQFKIAFDVTLFDGKTPIWESHKYAKLGTVGESMGLSWGGRWTKADLPHYYLRPPFAAAMSESEMIAELRRRRDNGIDVFA